MRTRHRATPNLGDHLAERVDIGPRIHGLAGHLLGRHVGRRAEMLQRIRTPRHERDAEIDQHRPLAALLAARHDDVLRLEVAMHDAPPMKHGECVGDTGEKLEQPLRFGVGGVELPQRRPLDEALHDEQRTARRHAQIEHAGEARILELRRRGILRLDGAHRGLAICLRQAPEIDPLERHVPAVGHVDARETSPTPPFPKSPKRIKRRSRAVPPPITSMVSASSSKCSAPALFSMSARISSATSTRLYSSALRRPCANASRAAPPGRA
ncbi:hypothetical protein AUC71_01305 [Methyloceanibacter marginalis]|uniref:Uncharacterized protein n=1 Tax=Methyloceanibacter marginalis TaxID=1774971 RepID=A0A1E3WCQ3_9HYPH|nr:hypothetical protein AUC71_01305 [Methyloceanibacter marginalis]